jgi:anti-sigma regulatory factor (Ser/Thr protein kinase)
VTNAVTHAFSTARLSVTVADGLAGVTVTDDGPGRLSPRQPDDDGGYGLWLVDWLARSWGLGPHRRRQGRVVHRPAGRRSPALSIA